MPPKTTIPESLSSVSKGRISADLKGKILHETQNPSAGHNAFSLAVAVIEFVNYEELKVTLRVVAGEAHMNVIEAVPLAFPNAGARNFLGGLPCSGDMCIIGWMLRESTSVKMSKQPVILAYMPPATWMSLQGLPVQSHSPDEFGLTPKNRTEFNASVNRTRYKMRHMEEGDILASSSKGADIHLNDGVLITNRRANEIRLRDADQALITRSLQQFHATAGSRVYAGMVQRDATLLPPTVFSDGRFWESPRQVDQATGMPVSDFSNALYIEGGEKDFFKSVQGILYPHPLFDREPNGTKYFEGEMEYDLELDPFNFLFNGKIIDKDGRLQSSFQHGNESIYGGKSIYRIGLASDGAIRNAASSLDVPSLTEYRIEVAHTSDGTLPVTEQTDGFDADRLPDSKGDQNNVPFIEVVYGSVVGNDPYSDEGRTVYGIPLRPIVLDQSGSLSPSLAPAIGFPLEDHAATLLKIKSPVDVDQKPSFFSFTKDGSFKAFLSSDRTPYSVEVAAKSGIYLQSSRKIVLDAADGVQFNAKGVTENGFGLDLNSPSNATRVYGGGRAKSQKAPNATTDMDTPSLMLEGKDNVWVVAGKSVRVRSSAIALENAASISLAATSNVSVASGEKVTITANSYDLTVQGKATEVFMGPKNGLPTSGAAKKTVFAGLYTPFQAVEETTIVSGSQTCTILAGNHETTCLVGNQSYVTNLGKIESRAGLNFQTLDSVTGFSADLGVGNFSANVGTGAVSLFATVSATVQTIGIAKLGGVAGVELAAPGKIGGIVSSSDICHWTGLPLATFGYGSPAHRLTLL